MNEEVKDNGIINMGNVNINEEKMKDYLLHSYLSGKSLKITNQVFVLEQRYQALVEAVSSFNLSVEERLMLNEFKI